MNAIIIDDEENANNFLETTIKNNIKIKYNTNIKK